MKQGKNPTRTQKEIIARKTIAGKQLNPCHWLVINDTGAINLPQTKLSDLTGISKAAILKPEECIAQPE